jgi:hypothetical protein
VRGGNCLLGRSQYCDAHMRMAVLSAELRAVRLAISVAVYLPFASAPSSLVITNCASTNKDTTTVPLCCLCRSAGGVSAAVALLTRSPSSTQQLHLLSLMTTLARSSEEAGAELAQAAVPSVLLQMVALDPLPRTQVC